MENNTMYFLRKNKNIEDKLVDQLGLQLSYQNKREKIFKNNDIFVCAKQNFISVLVYDGDQQKISKVKKICTLA